MEAVSRKAKGHLYFKNRVFGHYLKNESWKARGKQECRLKNLWLAREVLAVVFGGRDWCRYRDA